MKKLLIASLILFSMSAASARRGGSDEILNGGGIAEQNLVFSWSYLRELVIFCRDFSCTRDSETQTLLAEIQAHLAVDLQEGQLIFVKGSQRPDLFPPGSPRPQIFATGNTWGSKIYIDLEALAQTPSPLSIPQALDLLLQAEISHSGNKNEDLTQKLRTLFTGLAQGPYNEVTLISYGQPAVRLLTWNFPTSARMILTDSTQSLEVTQQILPKLTCPGDLEWTAARFTNLVWGDPMPWDETQQTQAFSFTGGVHYTCASGQRSLNIRVQLQGVVQATATWNQAPDADWIHHPEALVQLRPDSLQIFISHRQIESAEGK